MKLFLPPALAKVSAAALLLHGAAPATATLLAFPGAVGYGAYSLGGRGGAVHIVTSLADAGSGTLREALEASGPRTVVFEVSGYIDLTSEISIADPFVTVAGQTSPGGVTVRGSRIKVRASDVIVRGMRFRPGDGNGDSNCNSRDGFGIGTGSAPVEDVVFDHCSATWGMDENGSSWYTSHRTTISHCLFAEGLDRQCSNDGGFGYLIGTSGSDAPPSQLSLVRNAFISNRDRNPYVKDGATEVEVINNFSYNHVAAGLGFAGAGTIHAIKNYYKHGEDSIARPSCYLRADSADLMNVYLEGNVDTRERCDAATGEETDICHKESNAAVSPEEISSVPVFVGSGYAANAVDASLVPGEVFAEVGAIHPVRDSIDARILSTANMGTADCADLGSGAIISSVAAVGGYPAVTAPPTAPPDSDRDGIPDDVEDAMGLDKTDSSDSSGLASSGYTWLEEYINSFYTGFSTGTGSPSQSPTKAPTQSPTSSASCGDLGPPGCLIGVPCSGSTCKNCCCGHTNLGQGAKVCNT